MTVTVDARGLACPQPVILTRNAMRSSDDVTTLVSTKDQVANVQRLAERAGWDVTVSPREDALAIHMIKGTVAREPQTTPDLGTSAIGPEFGRVVVLASDQIGRGEAALGEILMRSLLYSLQQVDARPDVLILMNGGVRLAVEDSPVLADLQALEAAGTQVLICGTCADYFELRNRLAVGSVSNMYVIAEMLLNASHSVVF
ncbi:MAG: sulfurtransferase-like selenium metabolism protein YedF [Anaerolineae bacterium]|jgi:selenium metabolism protein YedF|nr:sulfurtransferase-like selenium metabolism protein YedF [Chloroflexota bacterium]